jgi:hypothetical protein
VAHGGVLRTFRHLIEGIPGPDLVKWIPPQDAIIHFSNGTMRQIGGGENNLPGYV